MKLTLDAPESRIESLAALDPEALRLLLTTHRRNGYDAGYRMAIADVLTAAVFVAEKSLRSARDPNDSRAVIYRFLELLENETASLAKAEDVVSDGLGI